MSNLIQNIKTAGNKIHESLDPMLEKAGKVMKTTAAVAASVVISAVVVTTCALTALGIAAVVGCASAIFFVSAIAITALRNMVWLSTNLFDELKPQINRS